MFIGINLTSIKIIKLKIKWQPSTTEEGNKMLGIADAITLAIRNGNFIF